MKKLDIKLLYRIFKMEQLELKRFLNGLLRSYGYMPISLNGALYAEGTLPVVMVAHMDIVPVVPTYISNKKGVLSGKNGLGADDRAGIYSIIHLLDEGYRPTILFTEDEEIGCVGARKFVKANVELPEDIKFFIELDRRGFEDCVFYDCDNLDFQDYISKFGFKVDWGSCSDISDLCPAYGISGVNLSIGYYNEHTSVETLVLSDMELTIKRVMNIFNNLPEDAFKYIPTVYRYKYGYSYSDAGYAKLDYSRLAHGWDDSTVDQSDSHGEMIELLEGIILLDDSEIIEIDMYSESIYMDRYGNVFDGDFNQIEGVYASNEFEELEYDEVIKRGGYAYVI